MLTYLKMVGKRILSTYHLLASKGHFRAVTWRGSPESPGRHVRTADDMWQVRYRVEV